MDYPQSAWALEAPHQFNIVWRDGGDEKKSMIATVEMPTGESVLVHVSHNIHPMGEQWRVAITTSGYNPLKSVQYASLTAATAAVPALLAAIAHTRRLDLAAASAMDALITRTSFIPE